MRRLLFGLVLAVLASSAAFAAEPLVRTPASCEGSSGAATINEATWNADCVLAGLASDCIDSLGSEYECFQIAGYSSTDEMYATVAIFLDTEPVQGQTYTLGLPGVHGAMVVGNTGLWITAEAPYTGTVTITVYEPSSNIVECTFSFQAQSILFGGDLNVTNGSFIGKLLPVEPQTWTGVKGLYR